MQNSLFYLEKAAFFTLFCFCWKSFLCCFGLSGEKKFFWQNQIFVVTLQMISKEKIEIIFELTLLFSQCKRLENKCKK